MKLFLTLASFVITTVAYTQELYQMNETATSRMSSFENMNGLKGQGGKTNKTAKGDAFIFLKAGESRTLLDVKNTGIIQRIWCTINERTPVMLRSLRIQMFWDGSLKPAVDVPFGDFFGIGIGKTAAFQSSLFTNPEGRSFNCYIPMPFSKGAKVVIINESKTTNTMFFYDIDFLQLQKLPLNTLYFHAYWTRQANNALGKDFEVLPVIKGKGRFLGMNVGVLADTAYGETWWGEGEVKMYIDGDKDYPTINGTGAEDYIGTGWGLGTYSNLYQGCTVADEKTKQYAFYRFHIPDAIFFNTDLFVTLQEIGGGPGRLVDSLLEEKVKLKPVSIALENDFIKLLDETNAPNSKDSLFQKGWVNFYRVDDYSATSYFYLDKPVSALPDLSPVEERIRNLR